MGQRYGEEFNREAVRLSLTSRLSRKQLSTDFRMGLTCMPYTQRRKHTRAENSHQPFRQREEAMVKFRDVKTLQKFSAVHASIYNHFNLEHHLNLRNFF